MKENEQLVAGCWLQEDKKHFVHATLQKTAQLLLLTVWAAANAATSTLMSTSARGGGVGCRGLHLGFVILRVFVLAGVVLLRLIIRV